MTEGEEFIPERGRRENQEVRILREALVHHVSTFIMSARLGEYDKARLAESKLALTRFKSKTLNPPLERSLVVLEQKLNSVNTENEVDLSLLDEIATDLDGVRGIDPF